MKKFLSKGLRAMIWFLLGSLLLIGFLQTTPGKAVLASALSHLLSRSDDLDVYIGNISGWIPIDVRVDHVEIGDAEGEWLSARLLHCRWIIHELWEGRIRVTQLGAEEIELYRLPKTGRSSSSRQGEVRGRQWLDMEVDGLQVDKLRLDKDVSGVALEYSVLSGGLGLSSGELIAGVEIGGDAEGWVDLEASLARMEGSQMRLSVELDQMNHPSYGLDRISGSAEAIIDAQGVDAKVSADLRKGEWSGHVATQLGYAANRLHLHQFRFKSPDYAVAGDLALAFSKGMIDVKIDSSYIDSLTNNYALRGAATIATSNKTWSVDLSSLDIVGWDTVTLSMSGKMEPGRVDLNGRLEEFDIGLLPMAGISNFTGKASGLFSITGSLEVPQITAGLQVNRLTSKQEALDELPKLDFRIAASVTEGTLRAATTLTNTSRGFLVADLSMPCDFSFSPFNFTLDPARLQGSMEADLDLAVFNGLALLDDQHVEGVLKTRLAWKDRTPSGFLTLEGGAYENYDLGILFRDFVVELAATPDGFVFTKATAGDGATGRLELSGGLKGSLLDMRLDLSRAKIVQRPEVVASVSGSLTLAGRISHPDIRGKLRIDRADILPDNIVSAKPPLLTDFDINAQTNETVAAKARNPLPFSMDVVVELPDQVYVTASLIASIWGGSLRVYDTPAGLSVQGKIAPRRGYVDFIGNKFRFQEGEIVLAGEVPPEPVFNNLVAEYSRSYFTARLVLNGDLYNPQYLLESTPAMPQDEILSHVLFNRDTSSISPYQAIQIAMAAKQLSGGLSGPGFMYQVRRAVGIDTLEFREPEVEGGRSSVAAGKYLTSELYVEVSSTVGSEADTSMMAEYEITRHFSVETSAGPKIRPGIGINWKYDY